MAAKDDKKTSDVAATSNAGFDLASFLPPELKGAKLEETGGLTPLYIPEMANEKAYPPVVGFMKGIERLPVDTFDSFCIRVKVTTATKACTGKGPDWNTVDVEVGQEVLIPISGRLRNDSELLRHATDRRNYFFAVIAPTGKLKVNDKPSKMWTFKTMIAKDRPQKREGTEFEFRTADAPLLAKTNDGTLYDLRTGEVVQDPLVSSVKGDKVVDAQIDN